jgi:GT2 family glycosyltransferase
MTAVAAIVLGTNECRWLDACLKSLTSVEAEGLDLTFYYVDNASRDGSREFVSSQYPQATVIHNQRNEGFAAGNNVGMRTALARGVDYVLIINPDTQSPPLMIRKLVSFMESHQQYGIVGPLQFEYGGDPAQLGDHNRWSKAALADGERSFWADELAVTEPPVHRLGPRAQDTLEHSYIPGSCMFIRATTLRSVGTFDETYETYFEDVDLCRRARWAGWRVAVLLNVGVQHYCGGGSTVAGQSQYRRVRIRRNRYYHLLTGIDWRISDALRVATRWLWQDLRGADHIGFEIARAHATGEAVAAVGWLTRRIPKIVSRRRRDRTGVASGHDQMDVPAR